MYDKLAQIKKKINEMRLVPCPAIAPRSCGLQNLLLLDANSPIAQRLKYPYIAIFFPWITILLLADYNRGISTFSLDWFCIWNLFYIFKVPIPHKVQLPIEHVFLYHS
jgi:hypothetical protein